MFHFTSFDDCNDEMGLPMKDKNWNSVIDVLQSYLLNFCSIFEMHFQGSWIDKGATLRLKGL